MATRRSTSPVDEDLQRLYNEVWAGFAEETAASQSNEKDLENIYNVYGSRSTPSPGPQPAAPSTTQYSSFYHGMFQSLCKDRCIDLTGVNSFLGCRKVSSAFASSLITQVVSQGFATDSCQRFLE